SGCLAAGAHEFAPGVRSPHRPGGSILMSTRGWEAGPPDKITERNASCEEKGNRPSLGAYHPASIALQALVKLPLLAWRTIRWRAHRGRWLPGYLFRHRPFQRHALPEDVAVDVMVLIVDHFEPTRKQGDQAAVETVASWCQAYKRIAGRYLD